MNAYKIAENTIKKRKLASFNDFFILMVSGGSDSTALAYIMKEFAETRMAIVHINHNLRKNAIKDQQFVENLAKHLDIKCIVYSKDIKKISKENNQNIEACGHDIRYKCANNAVKIISELKNISKSKIKICSAHTADDRIENFYMRSIVGTGPGGLASIQYKNQNIIRPLLDLSKDELRDYIKSLDNPYIYENNQLWREDETNLNTERFRAYVRHNIIPLAKKQNPNMINNLCNSMNLIADESEYLEKEVCKILDNYFVFGEDNFLIKPQFKELDLVLKRRAIYNALIEIFKPGTRIETKSINSILQATEQNNYTDNIQENFSVHSNKLGTLVQTMKAYRISRNRL